MKHLRRRNEPRRKTGLAPVVGEAPVVLILGSFPSEESLRTRQYYANPRNQFWRLIEASIGISHDQPYKDRVETLKANGIALWDVLRSCERKGSSDGKIKMPTALPNDLTGFLKRNPSIKSVGINGRTAAVYFDRYFSALRTRGLNILTLPSSRSANTTQLEKKVQAWSSFVTPTIRRLRQQHGNRLVARGALARRRSLEEALVELRREFDEHLAALNHPGAAKKLRAVVDMPVRLHGRVKADAPATSGMPQYRVIPGREKLDGPIEWRVEDPQTHLVCTTLDKPTAVRIAAALALAEEVSASSDPTRTHEAVLRFRAGLPNS